MLRVTLTSLPDFERRLESSDLRALCNQAENTLRLWVERRRSVTVVVEGGSITDRKHVQTYLRDVETELRAVPPAGPAARIRR